MAASLRVEPFTIRIPDETISDLRDRIRRTRWPPAAPGAPWEQGTDLESLQALLEYWAGGFDWRARGRELNPLPRFPAAGGGGAIHFVPARGKSGRGTPPIFTHRWPRAVFQ